MKATPKLTGERYHNLQFVQGWNEGKPAWKTNIISSSGHNVLVVVVIGKQRQASLKTLRSPNGINKEI